MRLVGAYNDVRNDFAVKRFGKTMKELEEDAKDSKVAKEQLKAVKKFYPQRISEAEPKNVAN